MDMEEQNTPDRLQVTAYGDGGFRVLGERYEGSILVTPDEVLAWQVDADADLATLDITPFKMLAGKVDVLLIGTGEKHKPLPAALGQQLQDAGIPVDFMATGPACRTFNVLQAEGRPVAVALIAVD
jgi:uncharacterized protein